MGKRRKVIVKKTLSKGEARWPSTAAGFIIGGSSLVFIEFSLMQQGKELLSHLVAKLEYGDDAGNDHDWQCEF